MVRAPAFLLALLRRFLRAAPWVVPVFVGALIALSPTAGVERIRDLLFDEYQRFLPRPWSPDLPVRILSIDDDAISRIGQWPWPRARMAELIDRLNQNGAAVIALDILFSERDRLSPEALLNQLPALPERDALARAMAERSGEKDDPLRAAIAAAPVVAAMTLVNDGPPETTRPKAGFVLLGNDPTALPPRFERAIEPLPELRDAALGLGAINYIPDRDLIVRRAPMLFGVGPRANPVLVPTLTTEALRIAQSAQSLREGQPPDSPIVTGRGASRQRSFGTDAAIISVRVGDVDVPTDADGQVRVRFAGHQDGRFISASRLLAGDVPREEIEDRIILVGVTAASLGDIRSTPMDGVVPGVEIHAEVLEHAITGAELVRPDFAPGIEMLVLVFGGLLTAFAAMRLRPVGAALTVLLLAVIAGAASWYAFTGMALLYDPMIPTATWFITWGSTTVSVFRRTESERRSVRLAFSRYLAPAVVERLAADPGSLKLGGEARNLTVLFCDIRDFTSRSETLSAEGVVDFLHTLLTPLTTAVLDEAGTIDKYLGDGLMAFWNAPLDVPDHATRACRAALAMQRCIPAIDARLAAEAEAAGKPHIPVRIGVGINTGDAFVGNMGAEQRFDYSIIGDPVNVAARLETATKDFAAPIVVSGWTVQQTTGLRFVDLGEIALKGRRARASAYALHGEDPGIDDSFAEFLTLHRAVVAAAASGEDPTAAIAAVKDLTFAQPYALFYARVARREFSPSSSP